LKERCENQCRFRGGRSPARPVPQDQATMTLNHRNKFHGMVENCFCSIPPPVPLSRTWSPGAKVTDARNKRFSNAFFKILCCSESLWKRGITKLNIMWDKMGQTCPSLPRPKEGYTCKTLLQHEEFRWYPCQKLNSRQNL
jgi:hypothetical protein